MSVETSHFLRPGRLSAWLLAAALVAFAGCSTGQTAPDEPATDEAADEEGAAEEERVERDIPRLEPLEFADEDRPVEELGEVDGVQGYRVGDLTVLHKETPANSVVAARVFLSGGSANLTEETAGIEQLALNTAVGGGTEARSKDEFNAALDSMGSSVGAFSDRDFSGYSMKSVVDNFEETWGLMVEAMLEPALPEDELALQRDRHLAEIRSLSDNPDRLVSYVASRLMFEGHPYYNLQMGEAENVEAFGRDEVAGYQRAMLQPERMTVVVVGNVPREELLERVQRLARIEPSVELPQAQLTDFDADDSDLVVEQKEIPTNYIFGLYTAPSPGDEDYPAMRVATEYLRSRLFEEVRTKRNLTYAVSAGLSDRRKNYGYLYVTATDPDATMAVIYDEIERLKEGDFSEEALERARNVFITQHYMNQETNGSQASLLARSHLIAGDWEAYATTIERLEAVTAEDVEQVARRYIDNYHFGIVGDADAIDEDLFLHQDAPEPEPVGSEGEQPEPTPQQPPPEPAPEQPAPEGP